MSVLFAVICGIVQGTCEFLPVSSSGHLALLQGMFFRDPARTDLLAFNVALHLGTLAAVLIVFRCDIAALIPSFFTLAGKLIRGRIRSAGLTPGERMASAVLLGTLPMALAKLIDERVEALSSSVLAVGIILLINSAMLFISDRIPAGQIDQNGVKPKNALTVGFAQCAAVLPGLSRSGSSITAGLAQGFDRSFAVRFSFILSVPAVLGAALTEIPDAIRGGVPRSDLPACVAGAVTALICGVCAIKLLIRISKGSGFRPFARYCAAIGAAAVILGLCGIRFPVF